MLLPVENLRSSDGILGLTVPWSGSDSTSRCGGRPTSAIESDTRKLTHRARLTGMRSGTAPRLLQLLDHLGNADVVVNVDR
jgi:hypothetical protein